MTCHAHPYTIAHPGPNRALFNLTGDVPPTPASHSLFDRLRFEFRWPIAFESEEAVMEFIEIVGDQSPASERPLFKHKEERWLHRFDIEEAHWHMGGQLDMCLDNPLRGHLRFKLSLNFTRWAASLPSNRPADLYGLDCRELLKRDANDRSSVTLDQSDNCLIGGRQRAITVANASALMAMYLRAVEDLLNEALKNDPALPRGMTISSICLPSTPCQAEVYFEFSSSDAPSDVEGVRGAAIAGMADATTKIFRLKRLGCEARANAVSVIAPLTKTVMAKVYAKTMNVVRVEIVFSGEMRQHAYSRPMRNVPQPLNATLEGLRADASRRAVRFLRALAVQTTTTIRKDAFDLLDELHQAAGHDRIRARALLSLLGNYEGITATHEDGVAPSSVLSRLEQRGVLHRLRHRHANAGGRQRYALTPAYANAVRIHLAVSGLRQPPSTLN